MGEKSLEASNNIQENLYTSSEPLDPVVDTVEIDGQWLIGYLDGEEVCRMGPCEDFSHIHLYNRNNEEVAHSYAPLDQITQLQLAIAELCERMMYNG